MLQDKWFANTQNLRILGCNPPRPPTKPRNGKSGKLLRHQLAHLEHTFAALAQDKELAALLLSMVAELRLMQLLVITLGFLTSFLWNRSCQTSNLDNMLNQRAIQPSTFEGGLDDLEGSQASAEEIKTYLSQSDPAWYEVLEHTASSKQPIEEEKMIKASQDIMKDKHKALRVLQAKIARASLANSAEEEAQLPPIDEETPPEADERTECDFKLELERNQLQVRNEGRQLGYLLVQKTKGEAQLQVRRWLQSTNGWEAWRQLNLLYTTSKRSTRFKLLSSLMNPSFDTQPASFLQQFNAWKEQVVRYQQLSGENLPDFIKLTAVVNGLKGNVRHVLLSLDGDSSFGDLDSLLGKYFNNTYVQSLVATIHFSSVHVLFPQVFRRSFTGSFRNENSEFTQSLLCSLFTKFTGECNHPHVHSLFTANWF